MFKRTESCSVGAEVGVDVGDEVGAAVLKVAYCVTTGRQVSECMVCNWWSNAPEKIELFNERMNRSVARLVSLKICVDAV